MRSLHEVLVGIKKAILKEDLPDDVRNKAKSILKKGLTPMPAQELDALADMIDPGMEAKDIAQVVHDQTGEWPANEIVDEVTVLIQDEVPVETRKEDINWEKVHDSREKQWKGYREVP